MKHFYLLLIVLYLFSLNSVVSQTALKQRDIGMWMGIGVSYKLSEKWKINLEQQLRLDDNISDVDNLISEIGAKYRINNRFKLGANFRYDYTRKKNHLSEHDLRYNFDFIYRPRIKKKWRVNYRFRLQNRHINLFIFIPEDESKADLRHKITFSYPISKNNLKLSTEIFRTFEPYKKPVYSALRIVLKDEIKTNLGDFEGGLAYERELNQSIPLNFFFIQLYYTFKLKRAK